MTLQDVIEKVEKEYGDTGYKIVSVSDEDGREYIKFWNGSDLFPQYIVVYLDGLSE